MADAGAAGPRFETVDGLGVARQAMAAAFADPEVLRELDALVCVATRSRSAPTWRPPTPVGGSYPVIGFDNTPVAEAMGISSVEQSPELVARAVLDLLMGPTGRAVTALDSGSRPSTCS